MSAGEQQARALVREAIDEAFGPCSDAAPVAGYDFAARSMLINRIVNDLGPIMRGVVEADLHAAWLPPHEVHDLQREARYEGARQICQDLRVCLEGACRLTSIDLPCVLATLAIEEVHADTLLAESRQARALHGDDASPKEFTHARR